MPTEAHGTFEVKLTPQTDSQATIGKMLIEKQFYGALEATSKGEMLAISTKVSGSAGYVAIEQVTGILHGFRGSFALQHSGIMTRGTGQLTVTVVPDSGTDELAGLSGQMSIQINDEGKHSYIFEYTLTKTD